MTLFGRYLSLHDFVPPLLFKLLIKMGFLKNYKSREVTFYHDILKTYSQFQEDLIIDNLLGCKSTGFYVDVGANDPEELSNTKKFYDKGWSGINIEPNPLLIKKLEVKRSRDINLNLGIALEDGELEFCLLSAHTLSTFDKEAAKLNARIHGERIESKVVVPVSPLKKVFEENKVKEIDFMSVDTEGYDLIVLNSNDWSIFRPKLVMVEINQGGEKILDYLKDRDYLIVYQNPTNAILMDKRIKL